MDLCSELTDVAALILAHPWRTIALYLLGNLAAGFVEGLVTDWLRARRRRRNP